MLELPIYELKKSLPLAEAGTLVQLKPIPNSHNFHIWTLGSGKGKNPKNRRKIIGIIAAEQKNIWLKKKKFPTQKPNEKNFYFVCVDGGFAPKFRHYSLSDAKKEAKRLAKKTGQKTYIVLAIKKFEYEKYEFFETSYTTHISKNNAGF